MPADRRKATIVAALGIGQTLAWASSYYLPAILADPISADLGLSPTWFFAAFSVALLLSAVLGPAVGRAIDRQGGQDILVLSNLILALGLVLLGVATGPVSLCLAWAVLGTGMAFGLYDTAFSTLAGLYGQAARGAIVGVTLIAGFAGSIGWPATAWLADSFGWREACFAWAALHLALGLPLNRFLVPKAPPPDASAPSEGTVLPAPPAAMALLGFVFAATWFVTGALASHLPRLLEGVGATPAAALTAAALVGPAQVAARFLEYSVLRRLHPIVTSRLAALLDPCGAILLFAFGAPAIAAYALLFGASNGVLTMAKGTLPLAVFGAAGYGRRSGILSAPARVAQASAPLAYGLILDFDPWTAVATSSGLIVLVILALTALDLGRGRIARTA